MIKGLGRPMARVVISVVAARNYPLATVKLPEPQVQELDQLFQELQAHDPATTIDQVLQAVFRRGMKHGPRRSGAPNVNPT